MALGLKDPWSWIYVLTTVSWWEKDGGRGQAYSQQGQNAGHGFVLALHGLATQLSYTVNRALAKNSGDPTTTHSHPAGFSWQHSSLPQSWAGRTHLLLGPLSPHLPALLSPSPMAFLLCWLNEDIPPSYIHRPPSLAMGHTLAIHFHERNCYKLP